MEINDNGTEKPFEYGKETPELNPMDLEVGDFLYIISGNGSIYELTVIEKNEKGVKIKCTGGSRGLLDAQGIIKNEILRVGDRLKFGARSRVTSMRKIIPSKTEIKFKFDPLIYDEEAEGIDTEELKEGDYIHGKDDKGRVYIIKVAKVDPDIGDIELQPVLIRYPTDERKLHSRIIGKGFRLIAGDLKTPPIQRLMITRSVEEVFDVETKKQESSAEGWLPEEVLVSGVHFMYSSMEKEAITALELNPQFTLEELEIAWKRYFKSMQALFITDEGIDKAKYKIVQMGCDSLKRRFESE